MLLVLVLILLARHRRSGSRVAGFISTLVNLNQSDVRRLVHVVKKDNLNFSCICASEATRHTELAFMFSYVLSYSTSPTALWVNSLVLSVFSIVLLVVIFKISRRWITF